MGGRVGVLIEVNCETDFVARNDDFKEFVHDVALHIAAMKPQYVSADDVPEDIRESEREVFTAQSQDIPEAAREKAIAGRLAKRLKEFTLLDQEFVKDIGEKSPRTIEDLRVEAAAKLGEKVAIRRFSVFELGG
jgi:elongation factor Ts